MRRYVVNIQSWHNFMWNHLFHVSLLYYFRIRKSWIQSLSPNLSLTLDQRQRQRQCQCKCKCKCQYQYQCKRKCKCQCQCICQSVSIGD